MKPTVVSSYLETSSNVFLIGVFNSEVKNMSEEEIVSGIKKELIKRLWISPEAIIREHFKTSYCSECINHFQIKELNQLHKLTILSSTNFIYGLSNHIDRWRSIILE